MTLSRTNQLWDEGVLFHTVLVPLSMIMSWLRFDIRLMQWVKLLYFPKTFYIYGWWAILFWPIELILGMLHFLGCSYIAELFFRTGADRLSAKEVQVAQSVFGSNLDFDLIRINKHSRYAKRLRLAFVTGHVINYYRDLSYPLLIHELTHIYQYQQVGLVYIPRCLFAQSSKQGYDFGNVEDHDDILKGMSGLNKLNYEQQAEFLETLYKSQIEKMGLASLESVHPHLNLSV